MNTASNPIHCKTCNVIIQPYTAERNGGLCAPCCNQARLHRVSLGSGECVQCAAKIEKPDVQFRIALCDDCVKSAPYTVTRTARQHLFIPTFDTVVQAFFMPPRGNSRHRWIVAIKDDLTVYQATWRQFGIDIPPLPEVMKGTIVREHLDQIEAALREIDSQKANALRGDTWNQHWGDVYIHSPRLGVKCTMCIEYCQFLFEEKTQPQLDLSPYVAFRRAWDLIDNAAPLTTAMHIPPRPKTPRATNTSEMEPAPKPRFLTKLFRRW